MHITLHFYLALLMIIFNIKNHVNSYVIIIIVRKAMIIRLNDLVN